MINEEIFDRTWILWRLGTLKSRPAVGRSRQNISWAWWKWWRPSTETEHWEWRHESVSLPTARRSPLSLTRQADSPSGVRPFIFDNSSFFLSTQLGKLDARDTCNVRCLRSYLHYIYCVLSAAGAREKKAQRQASNGSGMQNGRKAQEKSLFKKNGEYRRRRERKKFSDIYSIFAKWFLLFFFFLFYCRNELT